MHLWQINKAINGVCRDIEEIIEIRKWSQMSEKEIVFEFILCILGSGVRYEMALSYALAIKSSKLLTNENINNPDYIEKEISFILNGKVNNYYRDKPFTKYRYPNIRSTYISKSLYSIYKDFDSFKKVFCDRKSPYDLRRYFVKACIGVGPKQASHFLKNIGYTNELAILDRHIVKYLELAKKDSVSAYQLGKIDKYEDIESQYINTVSDFKYPIAIIDQAMWFVMKALNSEVVT